MKASQNSLMHIIMALLVLATITVSLPTQAIEPSYGDMHDKNSPGFFSGQLRPFARTGAVIAPTNSVSPVDTGLERSGGTYVSSSGSGRVYCSLGSEARTNVAHNLVAEPGKMVNGEQLFRTDRQGLYFTFQIINVSASSIIYSPGTFYLIDGIKKTQSTVSNCRDIPAEGVPLSVDISVRYYIDNTFSPNANSQGLYASDFLVKWLINPNPGYALTANGPAVIFEASSGANTYIALQLNMTDFYVSGPTCYTAQLVGDNMKNSTTVDLGKYTTVEVKKNITRQVPFQVMLANCLAVSNIKVKLKTAFAARTDPTLLGNNSGTAQGAAVAIWAKSSTKTMLLRADSANTYTENEPDVWNSDFINLDDITSGTSQTLNFLAQVVRDGPVETVVTGGTVGANGTLVFSYE